MPFFPNVNEFIRLSQHADSCERALFVMLWCLLTLECPIHQGLGMGKGKEVVEARKGGGGGGGGEKKNLLS